MHTDSQWKMSQKKGVEKAVSPFCVWPVTSPNDAIFRVTSLLWISGEQLMTERQQ